MVDPTDAAMLPCPWCGVADRLRVTCVGSLTADMPDRPYQVRCGHLDCEDVAGPVAYGRGAAIAAWNRRAPASQPRTPAPGEGVGPWYCPKCLERNEWFGSLECTACGHRVPSNGEPK